MGVRPAHCYTKISGPANTRTKKYVRGVPGNKIVMYDMGHKSKEFEIDLHLVNSEACQIRHMSIEASRQVVNRALQKTLSRDEYHFRIRIHPHHVLRENKMMAFAGADRMQDGMRRSFGKPTDRSARVKVNSEILTVSVDLKHFEDAKNSLRKARITF
uniref:Putative 50S ribosomal protein L10e n=1 Tax=uncultured organism TaxID=155900 RepID=A0A0F6PX12_9ZZZZ|nr:putative 50S ribosomal protein L10e [uncultured organism]